MKKIKDIKPGTLFTHDNLIHIRLADDYPFNAVKMATGEGVRLTGEKIDENGIIAQWNELHAEMVRLFGAK
jgi:hypothetical protein